MSTRIERVVIAGAGIAGLTAAIALRRNGIEVVVLARDDGPGEPAAGHALSLSGAAIHALRDIDIAGAVTAIGAEITAHRYADWRGRRLGARDLSVRGGGRDAPSIGVGHAELRRLLLEAIGPDVVRPGMELIGFEQNTQRVLVRCADGSTERGDVLLGADGAASMVRRQLHGAGPTEAAGMLMSYAVTECADSRVPVDELWGYWGPGARFAHLPIGSGRLGWVASMKSPAGPPDSAAARKTALLDAFRGWPPHVQQMLTAAAAHETAAYAIAGRDRLSYRGFERVGLIGDAARPISGLAQGAGAAIEEAICLAEVLRTTRDPVAGLREFERRRTFAATRAARLVARMSLLEAQPLRAVRDNLLLRPLYALQSAAGSRSELVPQL